MDDVTLLQECVVSVEEMKEEPCDTFENREFDMPGENSVKTEYSTSESPVLDQNDSEEKELKPLAAVFVKTEVELDDETEEQDHLELYPLADCEELDEKETQADSLLVRVKKEEADAGTSSERSEQMATDEMKNDTLDANGSNRPESPYEEHEFSEPEIEDGPSHTNRQPFECAHCSETFRFKKTLKEHERQHQEQPRHLTCDTCQRQFTYSRSFMNHIKAHVNEADTKTKFLCETCGREFKYGYHLKRHLRIHTGEKPYVCNHCGKGFTQISDLNVHRRKHTGEQPYGCTICNKRFADKGNLVTHTKRHLNIKAFECKECGKTFVEKWQYTVHLRVHTGEKPFKCRFCETTFASSSNRLKHEETHSDKKVQCKECGKSFSSGEYLKKHMRCHTGEKS